MIIEEMKNSLTTDFVVPLYYWIIAGVLLITYLLLSGWRSRRRFNRLKSTVRDIDDRTKKQQEWASRLYEWLDKKW